MSSACGLEWDETSLSVTSKVDGCVIVVAGRPELWGDTGFGGKHRGCTMDANCNEPSCRQIP